MVKIRLATAADVLKVGRLWLQMVSEVMPDGRPNVDWWRRRQLELLEAPNYTMWVAEEGGRVLGFVDYLIFPEPATSRLHGVGQSFYVLPECRGNGVSGRLWKKAVTELKKDGAQDLEIICADKQRPFWEKRGFRFRYSYMRRKGSN